MAGIRASGREEGNYRSSGGNFSIGSHSASSAKHAVLSAPQFTEIT